MNIPSNDRTASRNAASGSLTKGSAVAFLPSLLKVERVSEDRGFGFASHVNEGNDYFFHVRSGLGGQQDFNAIRDGDLLLCQIGSRPKDKGRRCVVQWMRVDGLDWEGHEPPTAQSELDAIRRETLERWPMAHLHQRMEARWYHGQWGGDAPADLRDPILGAVWISKLAGCDASNLLAHRVAEQIALCRFSFRDHVDPASPLCCVKELLRHFTAEQLSLFGPPQIAWLDDQWTSPQSITFLNGDRQTDSAKLDATEKAAVVAWFIHCLLRAPDAINTDGWLPGKFGYEGIAAKQLAATHPEVITRLTSWLTGLAVKGHLDQPLCDALASANPVVGAQLYAQLSSKEQGQLRARWRADPDALASLIAADAALIDNIVAQGALAVDLESDGERVWEIGCASIDKVERLYDARHGGDLAPSLQALSARLADAQVVIGHNILAWDWPILNRHLPELAPALIWDTLLAEYLLDPRKPTHALGGSHHAESDADLSLRLFLNHLHMLPPLLAAKVLSGAYDTPAEMLVEVAPSLLARASVARTLPAELVAKRTAVAPLTLLPDHALDCVDWVPGGLIVSADPEVGLPADYMPIDAVRLEQHLRDRLSLDPRVIVLVALSRRLEADGIALRRSMVPLWLIEGDEAITGAIARASVVPKAGSAPAFAPFPRRVAWWNSADGAKFAALIANHQGLLIEEGPRHQPLFPKTTDTAREPLVAFPDPVAPVWLVRDAAAQRLDLAGGWRNFRYISLPADMVRLAPSLARSSHPPRIISRDYPALFPGSDDQASYWIGVLDVLRALKNGAAISSVAEGGVPVPVLLVESSSSQTLLTLLREACTTVGLAEMCPSYRSRREHLRRAISQGYVIIDTLNNWRAWQQIGRDLGAELQPIVDGLPLETWFAREQSGAAPQQQTSVEAERADTPATSATSEVKLLEALPTLVSRFFDEWLWSTGLAGSDRAPILLDARADVYRYELRGRLDTLAVEATSLTQEQREQLGIVLEGLQIQREEAPSDLASMEQFLVMNWQPPGQAGGNAVSGFKPTQKRAMEKICTRASDVMVTLPTGEGKSVLFQVPSLCRGLRNRRLTLVLSPLKALMQDQVLRLHEQGFSISVDYINSDRPRNERADVLQGILDHRIVLLYVAPERLRNKQFCEVLERRMASDGGLEYLVFDEAHCINQWGYEFRPDYFYAFSYLHQTLRGPRYLDKTPVLLLSATLTASDRGRLGEMLALNLPEPQRLPLAICPDPEQTSSPLREHISVQPMLVQGNILDTNDFENALAERIPHISAAIEKALENARETGQRSAVIIFVGRRAHADDLAVRLTNALGCDVESFHAGLEAATREEIYTRFKDGDLDVLVATKAFGMGMDIPDIHWVVHLSPPAYVEDYLQEVGRIGRGAVQRQRARLERMDALLLGSASDFESIRSQRAQNAINVPDIVDIETRVHAIKETIEGRQIALVPEQGFEPFSTSAKRRANATKLRMALYWLEKAGKIAMCGRIADLATLTLNMSLARKTAVEDSPVGRVALALLRASGDDNTLAPSPQGRSFTSDDSEGGLLNWLMNIVGLRVAERRPIAPASPPSSPRTDEGERRMLVNIGQLVNECALPSRDELFTYLAALQERKAIALESLIEFTARKLLFEEQSRKDRLIDAVVSAVRRLIGQASQRGKLEILPFDYLEPDAFDFWPDETSILSTKERAEREALLARFRRAFMYGLRSLATASGLSLRQTVRGASAQVKWSVRLPSARKQQALTRCDAFAAMLPTLLSLFIDAVKLGRAEIETAVLVSQIKSAHPRKEFRFGDLEKLLRIASSLNLVSVQPDLVPLAYVVDVTGQATGLEQHPEVVEELAEVNALAELRSFAMEVFANLPGTARDNFISGYFAQPGRTELKSFLEAQLGEIENDGEAASHFITAKLDQLRATKAEAFFKRYEKSEEPAQWQAMSHPYDHHLLVNAGPGAGKTSVLVGRVAHLIRYQHVKPSDIIVLAFNRAVVFEIRQRIRDLFRSLGYAAYASQVRVHTFHGLARASMSDMPDVEMANLLETFSSRLAKDPLFRDRVANGCRSILIDEFQDVSDNVYELIKHLYLGSGARAGVMVIGDDDQDILRWQRRSDKRKLGGFAEKYFDLFRDDFGGEQLTTIELSVNFRSDAGIVDLSQSMISRFFGSNTRSRRLKTSLLRPSLNAGPGECERIVVTDRSRAHILASVVEKAQMLGAQRQGSLAILCRTNDEVAELHRALSPVFPRITVQNSENMRIADLRHVALWCEFLEAELATSDRTLSVPLRDEMLQTFRAATDIPETVTSGDGDVSLAMLWDLCCEESVFPHLSTLLRFMRNLQRDELLRLTGQRASGHEVVVSTIHKVKGLEYDSVIIVPSRASFGERGAGAASLEEDAAEEARLLYVALTRAKRRLVNFVGAREFAWARAEPRDRPGEEGSDKVLTGAHHQIDLGWALRRTSFNPDPDDCQSYIAQQVAVGDRLRLGGVGSRRGMTLIHIGSTGSERQIGCLASKMGSGSDDADLRVSAVVRYPIKDLDPTQTGARCAQRGWGYAVLVAGRLR